MRCSTYCKQRFYEFAGSAILNSTLESFELMFEIRQTRHPRCFPKVTTHRTEFDHVPHVVEVRHRARERRHRGRRQQHDERSGHPLPQLIAREVEPRREPPFIHNDERVAVRNDDPLVPRKPPPQQEIKFPRSVGPCRKLRQRRHAVHPRPLPQPTHDLAARALVDDHDDEREVPRVATQRPAQERECLVDVEGGLRQHEVDHFASLKRRLRTTSGWTSNHVSERSNWYSSTNR